MRILLADDSLAMRTVFRRVLKKLGHADPDILEAKEGRDVLFAIQNPKNPIDLVVFDWDLPGLDGLGLMSHLKSLGQTDGTCVLLSVNRQQRALVAQAAKLGFCDSIDRPFTEEAFEQKLRGLKRTLTAKNGESTTRSKAVPVLAGASPATPFLAQLSSAVMDDLLKLADERQHEAGATLLRVGQICDALHFVTRGQVEVHSGASGIRIVREGDPFGEFSFMMLEPSAYAVQAKTVVMTASLSKARISELFRKHPSLVEDFTALLDRHREAMNVRATTIVRSDFKGTFDTLPFANVLQILSVGRKSGVLGIRQDENSGGIYLEGGSAVHAWTDELKGEGAFYAMSSWTRAKFAFNSLRRESERTLVKPTLTLLMEAMRRREEEAASPVDLQNSGLDGLFPPG